MTRFRYSNAPREIEVYDFDRVVNSHCRMCHGGCGVLVYVKDDRVVKIAGDPDCPISHGTLCSKGIAVDAARLPPRPADPPGAPHRAQGQRQVGAHQLGRGPGHHRRADADLQGTSTGPSRW